MTAPVKRAVVPVRRDNFSVTLAGAGGWRILGRKEIGMRILYGKSMWGSAPCDTGVFLDRAKADGFDAVELPCGHLPEPAERLARMCEERGLAWVAALATAGRNPEEHARSLERSVREAAAGRPDWINVHTGKDWFAMADNLALFELASNLARELAVRLVHETHRGRALFAAPVTVEYLRAAPDLRLCADLSHWMVVHESGLEDQPGAVAAAIERADCIHARVGFAEGPQVPHPLAPEAAEDLERHVSIWRRILDRRAAAKAESVLITPEFGPAPYMPRLPFTAQPVADEWRVNVEFKDWLKANVTGGLP